MYSDIKVYNQIQKIVDVTRDVNTHMRVKSEHRL